MKKLLIALLTINISAAAILFGSLQQPARAAGEGEVMFLLDASSSMLVSDDGTTTRIDKAKNALSSTLDTIPADVKVGLRVYGSQVPDTDEVNGCQDSQLISKPVINNTASLKSAVSAVQAKGWTLMGKSLQDIQGDFQGDGTKTVILISDGIDTCTPPDACEIAKNLMSGESKIKVNTVGLLVSAEARAQLNCIAANSGGNYYDINDINKLQETLEALAKREVTLFVKDTVPIEGTVVRQDAPFMLDETVYTDTLIVPEQLHYGYDALPEQQVTINIKATNPGLIFKPTDYIRVTGYNLDTGDLLSATGITGNSQSFKYAGDSLELNYVVDTSLQNLDKPSRLAFKVALSTDGNRFDGTEIPLEMKITSTGGRAVDYQEAVPVAKSGISADVRRTFITAAVMISLIVVTAVVLYALKRHGVFDSKA
jgi:hypothetical protein